MEQEKPVREIVQRIAFEMQEAGATKWQAMRVLRELEDMGGNEQQLKKKAHEVIEKLNPEAAKTFISFERMKVFTSKEKRERFDRGNIIKSLLRETKVSRAVAEKIGGEVEGRVKDMKIEYLNTPLIREMVSSKLLEYGHEPVHSDYSRIGMPVFEVRKRLDAAMFENPEILREYTWLSAITGKAREMHFDSLMHIFHPEDFCTKIHCAPVHFSGEPDDMAIAAKSSDALCSLPVTASAWNFSLASTGVAGKKIMAKAQAADKIFSLTKGKRMAELALFADFEWKAEACFKKKAVHAAVAMQQSAQGSFSTYVSVDSKYQLKLLGKKFIPSLTIVNNSRERAMLYPGAIAIGSPAGILQLVGINLEKIAQLSGEERGFFSLLDETAKVIAGLCVEKRQELAKRPYMDKGLAGQSSPAVCLSGLLRAARLINPESPSKIAESVIVELQKMGFLVMEMDEGEALSRFDAIAERDATQKMLLGLGMKARKNYGFAYEAPSLKEAEALLGDAICVRLRAQPPENKF